MAVTLSVPGSQAHRSNPNWEQQDLWRPWRLHRKTHRHASHAVHNRQHRMLQQTHKLTWGINTWATWVINGYHKFPTAWNMSRHCGPCGNPTYDSWNAGGIQPPWSPYWHQVPTCENGSPGMGSALKWLMIRSRSACGVSPRRIPGRTPNLSSGGAQDSLGAENGVYHGRIPV
jgi:hypothetical protein